METRSSPSMAVLHSLARTAGLPHYSAAPKPLLFLQLREQFDLQRLARVHSREKKKPKGEPNRKKRARSASPCPPPADPAFADADLGPSSSANLCDDPGASSHNKTRHKNSENKNKNKKKKHRKKHVSNKEEDRLESAHCKEANAKKEAAQSSVSSDPRASGPLKMKKKKKTTTLWDPVMLTELGPDDLTWTCTRPNGQKVVYGVLSLVDYMLCSGDFTEPHTRVPFTDDQLREIDALVSKQHFASSSSALLEAAVAATPSSSSPLLSPLGGAAVATTTTTSSSSSSSSSGGEEDSASSRTTAVVGGSEEEVAGAADSVSLPAEEANPNEGSSSGGGAPSLVDDTHAARGGGDRSGSGSGVRESVLSAKRNPARFQEANFRRDALNGLERCAGEVVVEMVAVVEACRGFQDFNADDGETAAAVGGSTTTTAAAAASGSNSISNNSSRGSDAWLDAEEAQLRLALSLFPTFTDLHRQIVEADAEFGRQCLDSFTAFARGPPNRPTRDRGGLLPMVEGFLADLSPPAPSALQPAASATQSSS